MRNSKIIGIKNFRSGRLLDHVHNKTVMFNQVSVLILDEADRMLDMGFMPDFIEKAAAANSGLSRTQ